MCTKVKVINFLLQKLKRYWVNEEFFNGNGPVFIMIGGEGEENPIWMNNGQWIVFAKQFVIHKEKKKFHIIYVIILFLLKNALCVMLEHRFYGKSRPTEYVLY